MPVVAKREQLGRRGQHLMGPIHRTGLQGGCMKKDGSRKAEKDYKPKPVTLLCSCLFLVPLRGIELRTFTLRMCCSTN